MTSFLRKEKNFQAISLIIAPVLFATSTFFWMNGEYNVPSATLLILSLFFWIPALTGLFTLLKNKFPNYAIYGLWIAVFGCISGICFAFLGYLTTIFQIGHEEYLSVLAKYPLTSQLLLFASGPLFPLSFVVLGILLFRNSTIPAWQSLTLSIAGLAFPVSRIMRVQSIAHLADLLFLIPCFFIALSFFKKKN